MKELEKNELMEVDGGVIEFLYEFFTGRSLASDARLLTAAALDAYGEVIREGGTVCTGMPFK